MNDQPENSEVELDDESLQLASGGSINSVLSSNSTHPVGGGGSGTAPVTYNSTIYV